MNSMIAREPYVAGYPDLLSYPPGEEVSFACSTSAREFSAEVARVGGQRQIVWEREGLTGHIHEVRQDAASLGLRLAAGFWRQDLTRLALRLLRGRVESSRTR